MIFISDILSDFLLWLTKKQIQIQRLTESSKALQIQLQNTKCVKKIRFEFRINEKIKTVSITISDFQILFKFIRFRFFIRYFSNKSHIYIL